MNISVKATRINPKHEQEWLNSCVDPEIVNLNVRSLTNTLPYEYLFYGLDNSERTNTGVLRSHWLRNYKHIEHGGWWCNGINLLTGEESEWGCFKPDSPRTQGNKVIKYEHPPQTKTELFALQIPDHIWEKVADRYAIEKTGDSFWEWVKGNHHIPILITEGAKKAGALLTAGYAAIALPGINSGYRNDGTLSLIPQLEVFCQKYREIIFAFDCDRNPKTYQNVNRAAIATGNLFAAKGCDVSVMTWDNDQGKGIDDVIKKSAIAVEDLVDSRISLKEFRDKVKSKAPKLDLLSAIEFTGAELEGRLSFDDLACEILLDGQVLKLDKGTRGWFCDTYQVLINKEDLFETLVYTAKKSTFNPVLRYLDSVHRHAKRVDISNLASRYFGTDDPLYDKFVKNWLISAVARMYDPGCKIDTTLILQGHQHQKKSTFFNVLGGEWFTDSIDDISKVSSLQTLHATWIIELGEFERITSKKAAGELKTYLTIQADRFRKPYGYAPEKYPRRSVFCGSVNQVDFLVDPTGNRRFWIIPVSELVEQIDINKLKAERDGLWASAVDAFLAGHEWHLSLADEALNALNNKTFEVTDEWESEIFNYLLPKSETTVKDILSNHFNIDIALQDKRIQMRVSQILIKLGWKKKGLTRHEGSRVVVWIPILAPTTENKNFINFQKGVDGVDGVDNPDRETFLGVNTSVNTFIKNGVGVDSPNKNQEGVNTSTENVNTSTKGVDSPKVSHDKGFTKVSTPSTPFSPFLKNMKNKKSEGEEEEGHTTQFSIGQVVRYLYDDQFVKVLKLLNDYQIKVINSRGFEDTIHPQTCVALTDEEMTTVKEQGLFKE